MTAVERLMRTIALLAADAETQASYLDGIGAGSGHDLDELALEFDDDFRACPRDQLTMPQLEALAALDRILETLGGSAHATFWNREALHNDPRWREVRGAARKVLAH